MRKVMALFLLLTGLVSCGGGGNDPQPEPPKGDLILYSDMDLNYLKDIVGEVINDDWSSLPVTDNRGQQGAASWPVVKFKNAVGKEILKLNGGMPQNLAESAFCYKESSDLLKFIGEWSCEIHKWIEGKGLVYDRLVEMTFTDESELIFHDYYAE